MVHYKQNNKSKTKNNVLDRGNEECKYKKTREGYTYHVIGLHTADSDA